MKKKKIFIIVALALILIISSIYNISGSYGNTLEARQGILSKRDNHAIILSEIYIENDIISEVLDQKSGYGYAQFDLNEKGNYLLKTKMIRSGQYDPIVTDIIEINDKSYEILMCYRSGLDHAEVIYTDDNTGISDEPIIVEMNNYHVAIIEAPEYTSYSRHVSFYNYKGDKFE